MKSKKNKKTKKSLNGTQGKTSSSPRYLFLGLSVLGLGVAGFIGYRFWKSRQQNIQLDISKTATNVKSSTYGKTIKRKWKDDSFPLSFNTVTNTGSSGPKVMQLQQKLNQKHNAGLDADGKLGPRTKEALLANGYPASVDLNTFNTIVDGEATLVFDPKRIADQIWKNANSGNFNAVLSQLRLIKDVSDYQSVNTTFKTFRDSSDYFHTHTLVTHLLDFSFKDNDAAKEQIKKEFLRMGLKEVNGKWSLSGFGKPLKLITLKNTYVRDTGGNIVAVKRNTILGIEQFSTQGLTWFKAIDGSMAAVPSSDIKYTN
jgi:peptidoglycan hydrolase-like protein with peptidoglycan-binding domain